MIDSDSLGEPVLAPPPIVPCRQCEVASRVVKSLLAAYLEENARANPAYAAAARWLKRARP